MEKTYCANEECPRHTEYNGGRFRFSEAQKKWFCEECIGFYSVAEPGKELWNFTTTHLNGSPIHVKNAAHLRSLEREYGVSSQALNNYTRNWDVPPPVKPHPEVTW